MRRYLPFLHFLLVVAGMVCGMQRYAHASPQTCPHAAEIASVANFLLVEPKEVTRFWRDREASDAAFLKIRYSAMPYADARALLAMLGQRMKVPERWLELDLSHASPQDRAARIASLDKPVLNNIGPSTFRALILQDSGEWLLAELARSRDELQVNDGLRKTIDSEIARSIVDLSDSQKRAFGGKAEAMGELRLAHDVYTQEIDWSDLIAFLDRAPDDFYSAGPGARAEQRKYYIARALSDVLTSGHYERLVLPQEVKDLVSERPYSTVFAAIVLLGSRAPETDVLTTLLNQTGEIKIGAIAASLNGDIEAGRLDPDNNPDALVAVMSERIDLVFGRRRNEYLLGLLSMNAAFSGNEKTALAFLDESIARNALGSFIRTGAIPNRPATLSPAFDWERWLTIASQLRNDKSIEEPDGLIAGMLLMAANEPTEALDLLKMPTAWKTARELAHMLMLRLDRQCDRLLKPSMPGREPIYRFDAQ